MKEYPNKALKSLRDELSKYDRPVDNFVANTIIGNNHGICRQLLFLQLSIHLICKNRILLLPSCLPPQRRNPIESVFGPVDGKAQGHQFSQLFRQFDPDMGNLAD